MVPKNNFIKMIIDNALIIIILFIATSVFHQGYAQQTTVLIEDGRVITGKGNILDEASVVNTNDSIFSLTKQSFEAQKVSPSAWLDGFDAEIEQVMDDWSVPGLAIAIVTDSSVVWSQGFGERNIEAGTPVTDRTLFAIGSTSKAFTAAGIGILHDEGKIDWSKPVQEYLPQFKMHSEFATEEMTPVDLMTHRSGLPGHDWLWYAAEYSRESLFRRLRHLEPSASFRSTFQYQNLMYMTAGYLTGQVDGTTWEDFTRRRILDPLGMIRSTFSVETMQEADDYARPYEGGRDSTFLVDYRNVDAMGPAGSINSSVSEMTAWIQLLLNDGHHGDAQLIDSTTVSQLMRPRIVLEDTRPFKPETGGSLDRKSVV